MKTLTKILAVALAVCTVLSMVACAGDAETTVATTTEATTVETTTETTTVETTTEETTTEETTTETTTVETTTEETTTEETTTEETTTEETTTVKPEAFTEPADKVLADIIAKAIEMQGEIEYGLKDIEANPVSVDDDNCTNILGLTTEEFHANVVAAMESKPEMGHIPHSVVVIKVKDGVDLATLAEKIVMGTTPTRFGCLKPKTIVGAYADGYIMFAAGQKEDSEAIYNAFCELSATPVVRIDRKNDWDHGMPPRPDRG